MLAISNDRYANLLAPTACKNYNDVVAALQALSSRPEIKEPIQLSKDLVWVVDQIRMRYRLDPIGLMGPRNEPHVVMGTGYVPQLKVWHGTRVTTKGETLTQFNIRSLNIETSKGTEHVMRSGDAKTFVRRLNGDIFKLVDFEAEFYNTHSDFEEAVKAISLGGDNTYVPHMDENVRREVYQYFTSTDRVITPGIEEWTKSKKLVVEHNQSLLERQNFVRSFFTKRSVAIYEIPMVTEYKYFFHELEDLKPVGERVFFSDLQDLTDRFPHIVAATNILKMRKDKVFNGTGFVKDLNFVHISNYKEFVLDTSPNVVLFPYTRVPSEDEVRSTQNPPQETKPLAVESAISVLNF
jgi:hypothetical protein